MALDACGAPQASIDASGAFVLLGGSTVLLSGRYGALDTGGATVGPGAVDDFVVRSPLRPRLSRARDARCKQSALLRPGARRRRWHFLAGLAQLDHRSRLTGDW